jgi:SNF2 family DNA or RNA helicase
MIIHPQAHKYQVRALEFALKTKVRDHLTDYQSLDLGLGKTLIALMWLTNIEYRAVLVVSPIKVMYNVWPQEIKKWTPDITYTTVHGPDKLARLHEKVDVYLTNYESLVWLFKAIKKMKRVPFDAIILDEGTKIKDHRTQRYKAIRAMRDLFPAGKMILSGTPMPNSHLNLWSQYYFLDGGVRLGPSYGEYQARYFDPVDTDGRVWKIKSGCDHIIQERIRDVTFRLEGTDYIKMPSRIDNFIKIDLPKKVQEKYELLEEKYFLEMEEGSIEVFNKLALGTKLRQFVQGALYTDDGKGKGPRKYEVFHNEKLDVLKELVDNADGTPVLCAIQFIFELDLIREAYPNVPIIRGKVSNTEATRLVNAWNAKDLPLLLCHPGSLSHGMNMQYGGNILLWYALPWSGEIYEQFIGRLKRQGQREESVIVHHIIARNTIDVAIARGLKDRAKGQAGLLNYLNAYHKGEITDDRL